MRTRANWIFRQSFAQWTGELLLCAALIREFTAQNAVVQTTAALIFSLKCAVRAAPATVAGPILGCPAGSGTVLARTCTGASAATLRPAIPLWLDEQAAR